MYRRSLVSISAMTVLGLAFFSSTAIAQQKSLKEQLVGTWMLVSAEYTASSGTKRQPFGPLISRPQRSLLPQWRTITLPTMARGQ